ncbi:hypothetical protein [Phyllobacterium sp. SB3]|uniref:hypothetical protein n=1 Tax=Phyllobacterium sp. SB3 TaxID=3156073 RepID=UPI0032AF8162
MTRADGAPKVTQSRKSFFTSLLLKKHQPDAQKGKSSQQKPFRKVTNQEIKRCRRNEEQHIGSVKIPFATARPT